MDLPACAPSAPKKKKAAMQGLQRCKAGLAPGVVQGEGHDHVMTKAEYAEWNRGGALLKQLRLSQNLFRSLQLYFQLHLESQLFL